LDNGLSQEDFLKILLGITQDFFKDLLMSLVIMMDKHQQAIAGHLEMLVLLHHSISLSKFQLSSFMELF
jgi:hypothetical protein